jgi:hypothetical protein
MRRVGFVLVGLGIFGIALFLMATTEGFLFSGVSQAILRHLNHIALGVASAVLLFTGLTLLNRAEHQ